MEIVIGIVGSIAAVFVVIFGGRGLVALARGMRESRSQPSSSWGCRRSASDSQHSL